VEQMAFNLRDILRFFHGGEKKREPAFKSEKEAYDFCRNLYNKSGGVTPELRLAYEFYQKNLNDDCNKSFEAGRHTDFASNIER